jgi:hypothetical protein
VKRGSTSANGGAVSSLQPIKNVSGASESFYSSSRERPSTISCTIMPDGPRPRAIRLRVDEDIRQRVAFGLPSRLGLVLDQLRVCEEGDVRTPRHHRSRCGE